MKSHAARNCLPCQRYRHFHTEIGKFWNIQCVNHLYASALLGASTTMTTPRVWHSITHSTRNCWGLVVILLFTTLKTTPVLLWNHARKVRFLVENFDLKMSVKQSGGTFTPLHVWRQNGVNGRSFLLTSLISVIHLIYVEIKHVVYHHIVCGILLHWCMAGTKSVPLNL